MNPLENAGVAWLNGPKYAFSETMSGRSWKIPVMDALGYHGRSRALADSRTIHDVVRVFYGREFWKQDGFYQLYDVVLPPDQLLFQGGDDCDGWAMTHTQSINTALGKYGWKAYSLSYLADPFWMSHHFTAAQSPDGSWWHLQPQPTMENWVKYGDKNQVVYGPYKTLEELPAAVAAMYGVKVVWWDKRDGMYQKV